MEVLEAVTVECGSAEGSDVHVALQVLTFCLHLGGEGPKLTRQLGNGLSHGGHAVGWNGQEGLECACKLCNYEKIRLPS
jgi:hypothetical protein